MEQQKRKRGENWSCDEKEILRQLIAQSAHILEDKSTKSSVNLQKIKEWKNVQVKFNELTGKFRSGGELKLAWKRMKLSAKSNLSMQRREQRMTGGGEKPPSPSPEDLAVMAIAPHDFVIETNDYDSDALDPVPVPTINAAGIDSKPGPSFETVSFHIETCEDRPEKDFVSLQDTTNSEACVGEQATIKKKKSLQNRTDEMRQTIVESNAAFKKRQLEMMEEEHAYNVEIAKLKIQKLKLEISLLENKTRLQ
ncbi:hypothetical protein HW555_013168 [Spodoptera exigua]|uniref:Regulatory protein zeste n=1 Tax=Spodoptera exigua TaxID=7107 RepID=A0A835L2U0_SPOEX|nr:hypothetical protein HW555_013168 [Spodoptera exigua]